MNRFNLSVHARGRLLGTPAILAIGDRGGVRTFCMSAASDVKGHTSEGSPLKNPAQTWPGGTQNVLIARFSTHSIHAR